MLEQHGGWSFGRAILWSLAINLPLQAALLWINEEERVWFENWETSPYSTLGYLVGRVMSLPLLVAALVVIQNLMVAIAKTTLLKSILRWPWAQAALWLLGLLLLFGGTQRDYWTGEQNMPLVIGAGICWAAALGLGFLRAHRTRGPADK